MFWKKPAATPQLEVFESIRELKARDPELLKLKEKLYDDLREKYGFENVPENENLSEDLGPLKRDEVYVSALPLIPGLRADVNLPIVIEPTNMFSIAQSGERRLMRNSKGIYLRFATYEGDLLRVLKTAEVGAYHIKQNSKKV